MADELFSLETQDQINYKKELERSSRDRIRVYNPTDQDFDVYNDGYRWTVPGKDKDVGFGPGQQVFPRYLAVSFVTKLCDKIFMDKMDEQVKAENDRRVKAGLAKMNKWEEQAPFEINYSVLTEENKQKRKELLSMMWLGIEEEYGADMLKERATAPRPQSDDEFLKSLSSRRATTTPKTGSIDAVLGESKAEETKPIATTDLAGKTPFELQAMARKQGIDYAKTDKKEELIRKLSI